MNGAVIFDPLLPWPLVWALVVAALAFTGFALWRGLSGWWLRGLAAAAILAALANPSLQTEDRNPLSDIVVLVVTKAPVSACRTGPARSRRPSRGSRPKSTRSTTPSSGSCGSAMARATRARC